MLIGGKNTMPGEQEERKLQEAETAIQTVIAKANVFLQRIGQTLEN